MSLKTNVQKVCKIIKSDNFSKPLQQNKTSINKTPENYLGLYVISAAIMFLFLSGIASIMVPDNKLHFLREMSHSMEFIIISVISYFFGSKMTK
ncbi:MAG: hypothetical protein RL208_662 [Pseudomonadota bacterium]|jgi:hypothetical protein